MSLNMLSRDDDVKHKKAYTNAKANLSPHFKGSGDASELSDLSA
jgi:hypothetical protein